MLLANIFESPFGLLLIALVAILLFGHRLPGVARSLGSSVSEFKKGVREGEQDGAAPTQVAPPAQQSTLPTAQQVAPPPQRIEITVQPPPQKQ